MTSSDWERVFSAGRGNIQRDSSYKEKISHARDVQQKLAFRKDKEKKKKGHGGWKARSRVA